MLGRTEIMRYSKKTKFAKNDQGQEVVKSHVLSSTEWHIKFEFMLKGEFTKIQLCVILHNNPFN